VDIPEFLDNKLLEYVIDDYGMDGYVAKLGTG